MGPVVESNRRLLPYLVCRAASLLAVAMAPLVVTFAVLSTGAGAADVAMVSTARTLAMIAVLPAAGFLVDRVQARPLIFWSSAVASATHLILGVLFHFGSASLVEFMVAEVANGAASAIGIPVFTALLPRIVESGRLVHANSWVAIVRSGSSILGPLLASGVVAVGGEGSGLFANAAVFALTAISSLGVGSGEDREPTPAVSASPSRSRSLNLVRRPWVWSTIISFSIVNAVFSGIQSVVGPVVAVESDALGTSGWGVALGAMGVGMLVGGVRMMRLSPRRPLVLGLSVATLVSLPALALWSTPTTVGLSVAFLLAGVGMEIFTVCWQTVLQQNIPPEQLGRVSSADALGSYIAIPIGISLAGYLYEAVGVQLLPTAGLTIIVACLAPLALRSVRQLDNEADPAPPPG